VSMKGIGRVRARNLYDNGFTSLQALRRSDVASLARVPSIGTKLAAKIKETVGGKLKARDLKAARRDEVQTTLEDFNREAG